MSTEVEQSILGTILLKQGSVSEVSGLTPDDFLNERHGIIFRAILRLENDGKPHDLVSVTEFLRGNNCLDRVGGPAYIISLTDVIPFVGMLEHHSYLIRRAAKFKRLAEQCEVTRTAIMSGDFDTAEGHRVAVESIFDNGVTSGWVSLEDASKSAFDRVAEASNSEDGITGLRTGINRLDDHLGGLQKSDLIVIGARPGMGKTALALTIATASKAKTGFFSLEMQDIQLAGRFLSGLSGVSTTTMRSGQLSSDQWQKMNSAAGLTANYPIWIDDTACISVTSIRARAKKLQRKHGLELIIVDYMQLATAGIKGNQVQNISEVSRQLKKIAKELDVPVIALAQLNRKLEERSDKRPVLSDLRESGQLEQDADVILFIYRDWIYNKSSNPSETELINAKFRNGSTGTIPASFLPERVAFTDW